VQLSGKQNESSCCAFGTTNERLLVLASVPDAAHPVSFLGKSRSAARQEDRSTSYTSTAFSTAKSLHVNCIFHRKNCNVEHKPTACISDISCDESSTNGPFSSVNRISSPQKVK